MAYPYGECTWWVWNQVYDNTGIELPNWGNAENWYRRAQSAGYSTGGIYSAEPGDILCWGHRSSPSTVGHVQYVIRDNGSTLTITESWNDSSGAHPGVQQTISKSNPTYGQGTGFPFQGVIHISGGGGGGGDEPYVPTWYEATTDWQWNTNVPGGTEFVGIAEQRTVYRYFDYSTGQWSELTTTKPA